MLYGGGLFGLIFLIAWVWAIVDVIQTPDGAQRNLPKAAWIVLVILLGGLGALAWLAFGRPQAGSQTWNERLDARTDDHALTERERTELAKRDYYRRMDEELDRRLEEKRRLEGLEGG